MIYKHALADFSDRAGLRTLCRWRRRHKLRGMSKEESIGALRKAIEKMAAGFVASLEEKKANTQ
jgi:hypothetical protein